MHALAVCAPGSFQHVSNGRLFVGYESHPCHVKVGERPRVLERCSCRPAAYWGLIGLVGVERRSRYMRSTVSEFSPRRMSRLSPVQIVLSEKLGVTIRSVLQFV